MLVITRKAQARPSFLKRRSKKLFSGFRGLTGEKFFGPFFQKRTAFFLTLLALLTAFAWGSGGSHAFSVSTSNDDTYRAEFYTSSRWQRILHRGMDDPGYVRLYSNVDGRLVATSPVVDFFGGGNADILWLMAETGQVIVGRDVTFWHVHPVTRWGAVLPIRHEIGPGGDIKAIP